MLKIYDTEHNFLKFVDNCKNPYVTTELKTGLQSLVFQLPLNDENLAIAAEENYVETEDYNYVIKEVDYSKNDFIDVYCDANIEDLRTLVAVFDAFNISVEDAMKKAILQTGWTIEYNSKTLNAVEYKLEKTNSYDLIKQIRDDYDLECLFDTKNKIIKVYDHIGENKGVYFSNELRLRLLNRQGQSYEFATVLYPIGKDGLTIGVVNNGINILENYSYCNKYIPKYWIQDDIEHTEQLKMAAEAYLSYISSPIVSYSLELSSLGNSVSVGDNIIIVDKIKRTKQRQRIVKIVHYLHNPEKDKVELSNEIVNFTDTFIKYNSDYEKQIEYIKQNLATLS